MSRSYKRMLHSIKNNFPNGSSNYDFFFMLSYIYTFQLTILTFHLTKTLRWESYHSIAANYASKKLLNILQWKLKPRSFIYRLLLEETTYKPNPVYTSILTYYSRRKLTIELYVNVQYFIHSRTYEKQMYA